MSSKVVRRTFELIDAICEKGGPASLVDLFKQTHIPKPTILRILGELEELKLVIRYPDTNDFLITPGILAYDNVAAWVHFKNLFWPLMQAIHDKYDETVNLGILQELYVYYVAYIGSSQPLSWIVAPGVRDNFYSTALGLSITSTFSDDGVESMFAAAKSSALSRRLPFQASTVLSRIEEARNRGWVIDEEQTNVGVVCVGVPILVGDVAIGAVSVSIPTVRVSSAYTIDIANFLRETAATYTSGIEKNPLYDEDIFRFITTFR